MALIPVSDSQVATIVTSLEMRCKPPLRPMPESSLRLVAWHRPTAANYVALFRRVGEPWLWFSRAVMDAGRLLAIIHDPKVAIFAVVDRAGIEVGMLELDFREPAACALSYFGLAPELVGLGHGRWLMAQALQRAWAPGVARVWVHTCTLDHPRALGFYQAAGFRPYKRTIETFDDPRVTGLLPAGAAPHVPLLASRR